MAPGGNGTFPKNQSIANDNNSNNLFNIPVELLNHNFKSHNYSHQSLFNWLPVDDAQTQLQSNPGSSSYFNQLKQDIARYNTDPFLGVVKQILTNMRHSDSNEESSSTPPVSPCNNHFQPDKLAQHGEMIQAVESRLNQIREYIKTTLVMMESLKKSDDPRAQTQHEKLSRMVGDLYDSETKLSNLLKQYRSQGTENGEGESSNEEAAVAAAAAEQDRKRHLYNKMEESQRKLTQLQEQQSQLVGMQNAMTESLNEARELRNRLALLEPASQESAEEGVVDAETDAQMVALVAKLSQLQAKKQNMDQLIAQLDATQIADRCNNEVKSIREKEAELEGLKSQLAQLKALMHNATNGKEGGNETETFDDLEDEAESEQNNDATSEPQDASSNKPNLEEIQAVIKELKEQASLLQAARADVAALKQSYNLQNNSSNSPSSSTPLPQNSEANQTQCQEEAPKKDQSSRVSSANEMPSRRGSNSGASGDSHSNNLWPPPGLAGCQEDCNIGVQVPVDNGYAGNWIGVPAVATVSSTEYYRQLLLGSQAQQIQMMNNTIQNCYQMLHLQQREMQLMRKDIVELQQQLRHVQNQESSNSADTSPLIHFSQQQLPNKAALNSRDHWQNNLPSSFPPKRNTSSPKPTLDATLEMSGISTLSNSISLGLNDSSKEKETRMESNVFDSISSQSQMQQEEKCKEENICEEENSFYRMLFTNEGDSLIKQDQSQKLSDELKETLYSFVMANISRGDYLMFVMKKLKNISEDEYLRLCLLRSLCKLDNTQNRQNLLTEATDQTISEPNTSHSSEEDFEANAQINGIINATTDSQSSMTEMLVPVETKSTSFVHDNTASCSVSPLTSEFIQDLEVEHSRIENPTLQMGSNGKCEEILKIQVEPVVLNSDNEQDVILYNESNKN